MGCKLKWIESSRIVSVKDRIFGYDRFTEKGLSPWIISVFVLQGLNSFRSINQQPQGGGCRGDTMARCPPALSVAPQPSPPSPTTQRPSPPSSTSQHPCPLLAATVSSVTLSVLVGLHDNREIQWWLSQNRSLLAYFLCSRRCTSGKVVAHLDLSQSVLSFYLFQFVLALSISNNCTMRMTQQCCFHRLIIK